MKVLLGFLFVLISFLSCAQDLIVKRDSSVIFCKIVKEDSATIYYRQKTGEQTMELNIKKSDVISYYNKNAIVQNEIKRTDSLANVQPKKDTVNSKRDTIQTKVVSVPIKKDSVQPKRDSMNAKPLTLKSKSDSIFLNANYKCFYKGELITKKEALDLMKGDTAARKEMKKARANFAPVIPLGLGAVVLAGVFIVDAVSQGNFHWWAVGGGSIVLSVVAITLKHNCNIHLYKAVKLYNSDKDIAVTNIPKFELGMSSKGIGVCLKF